MYAYVSKKITLAHQKNIHTISWHDDEGWIAVGGDDGMLKIIKLEESFTKKTKDNKDQDETYHTMPVSTNDSSLQLNQTLEGHKQRVTCTTWNLIHRKLASADQSGLIIVWKRKTDGSFQEEMINNRYQFLVKDMRWAGNNGKHICIAYNDGTVTVGCVEGTRVWGKKIGCSLSSLCWSPSGTSILFVTQSQEVLQYDNAGDFTKKLILSTNGVNKSIMNSKYSDWKTQGHTAGEEIICIEWYDGRNGMLHVDAPDLAIVFANGIIELRRGLEDNDFILQQTNMKPLYSKWNQNGHILALCGSMDIEANRNNHKKSNVVQLYNPYGKLMKTTTIPGKNSISHMDWDGSGLKVAISINDSIYFIDVKNDHNWGVMNSTIVYSFSMINCPGQTVDFWNFKNNKVYRKPYDAYNICTSNRYCAILIKCVVSENEFEKSIRRTGQFMEKSWRLLLCDNTGNIIQSKMIKFDPDHMVMTVSHIIVTDHRNTYVWHYMPLDETKESGVNDCSIYDDFIAYRESEETEKMLDIFDELPCPAKPAYAYHIQKDCESGKIVSICASRSTFICACGGGILNIFSLPSISRVKRYQIESTPSYLSLNCSSTKLSVIDNNGFFRIFLLQGNDNEIFSNGKTILSPIGRGQKDSWSMQWSENDPDTCAIITKANLMFCEIKDKLVWREQIPSKHLVCGFRDMDIQLISLDEVIFRPDKKKNNMIISIETKSLKEMKFDLQANISDIVLLRSKYNPDRKLWRFIATESLLRMDFTTAEKAYAMADDYLGATLSRNISKFDSEMRQQADIAAFLGRDDEAENLYLDLDRVDLAIQFRQGIGHWDRVVQLVNEYGSEDIVLHEAWEKIGDCIADEQNWSQAASYFFEARCFEKTLSCHVKCRDFEGMEKLMNEINDGSPLLAVLAEQFSLMGMEKQAIQCYLKLDDIKSAIDLCIVLNKWEEAVRLAEQGNFPQIEGLISKYVRKLLDQGGSKLRAAELYRLTGRSVEAASLLSDFAEEVYKVSDGVDLLKAKKLHVLSALQVENHRNKTMNLSEISTRTGKSSTVSATTAATIDTLMSTDATERGKGLSRKILDNAWRGASATHYFLLAHRQFYGGNPKSAMLTSIRCAEFEHILISFDIYSLIALSSYLSGFYTICSKAFTKLETLPNLDSDRKKKIEELALQIFTSNPLNDEDNKNECLDKCYMDCLESGKGYKACLITGRYISKERVIQCKTCHHYMIEKELFRIKWISCPLCHTARDTDVTLVTISEEIDEIDDLTDLNTSFS